METITVFLIPVLFGTLMLRVLAIPMKHALRLVIHAAGGLVCLWLLNSIAGFTGILFPINMVTVTIAGAAGIPGILLLALLEIA